MSKDDFDPRFDPAFQPGFAGEVTPTPKRTSSPAQAALEAAREQAHKAAAVSTPEATDEPEAPARRGNPFLIALGVLALALIIGGLQGVRTVASVYETTDLAPNIDYTTVIMLSYASPLAIALGVAIIAGVLFMFASAWQRKP